MLPVGLDPKEHPIIARHWFGWRAVGEVAADIVMDIRFCRHVEQLHANGPRVVAELLAEISAERGIRTIVEQKLERYADLDPGVVDALGARDLDPPLTVVTGGRR